MRKWIHHHLLFTFIYEKMNGSFTFFIYTSFTRTISWYLTFYIYIAYEKMSQSLHCSSENLWIFHLLYLLSFFLKKNERIFHWLYLHLSWRIEWIFHLICLRNLCENEWIFHPYIYKIYKEMNGLFALCIYLILKTPATLTSLMRKWMYFLPSI